MMSSFIVEGVRFDFRTVLIALAYILLSLGVFDRMKSKYSELFQLWF